MPHPHAGWTAAVALGSLVVLTQAAPVRSDEGLFPCGDALYATSMYACLEGYSLCPVVDGTPMERCGDACYLSEIYTCVDGHLVFSPPTVPPMPSSSTSASTPSFAPEGNAPAGNATALVLGDLSDSDGNDLSRQSSAEAADYEQTMPTAMAFEPKSLFLDHPSEAASSDPSPMPPPEASVALASSDALTTATADAVSLPLAMGPTIDVDRPRFTVEIYPFDDFTTTISDKGMRPSDLDDQGFSTTCYEIALESSAALYDNPVQTAVTSYLYPEEVSSAMSSDQDASPTEAEAFTPSEEAPSPTIDMTLSPSGGTDGLLDDVREGADAEPDYFATNAIPFGLSSAMVDSWSQFSIIWAVSNRSLCAALRPRDGDVAGVQVYTSISNTSGLESSFLRVPEIDIPVGYDSVINWMAYLALALPIYVKENPASFLSSIGELVSGAQSGMPLYHVPILLAFYAQYHPEAVMHLAEKYGSRFRERVDGVCMAILDKCAGFADAPAVDELFHLPGPLPYGDLTADELGTPPEMAPYVINAAVIPAALRSVSSLVAAGLLPQSYDERASRYAQMWEDDTLRFFQQTPREEEAGELLSWYASAENPTTMPDTWLTNILYYGSGIGSSSNATTVAPIMSMDDCFRLLLLNTTDDAQLSTFLGQAADHVLKPYPFGLRAGDRFVTSNTVFANGLPDQEHPGSLQDLVARTEESWTLPAFAVGLGRQLGRCGASSPPEFCNNNELRAKIVQAYDELWDGMERQGEGSVVKEYDLGVVRLEFM